MTEEKPVSHSCAHLSFPENSGIRDLGTPLWAATAGAESLGRSSPAQLPALWVWAGYIPVLFLPLCPPPGSWWEPTHVPLGTARERQAFQCPLPLLLLLIMLPLNLKNLYSSFKT